jgi:hypothetical protein
MRKRYPRDYKDEYRRYGASDDAKKKRAARNTARRRLERSGRVRKGDGNPLNNSSSNIRVRSRSANRGDH